MAKHCSARQRNCIGCNVEIFETSRPDPPPDTREQVLSPQTAYQVVSMLEGAVTRGAGGAFRPLASRWRVKPARQMTVRRGLSVSRLIWWPVFMSDMTTIAPWAREKTAVASQRHFPEFMEQALGDMPTPPFGCRRGYLVRINAKPASWRDRMMKQSFWKPSNWARSRRAIASKWLWRRHRQ